MIGQSFGARIDSKTISITMHYIRFCKTIERKYHDVRSSFIRTLSNNELIPVVINDVVDIHGFDDDYLGFLISGQYTVRIKKTLHF